jgi:hypothetical protein
MNSIVKKNIHFALIFNTLPVDILKKSCKGSEEMTGRTMQVISKGMSMRWLFLIIDDLFECFCFSTPDGTIRKVRFWRQQPCLLLT